MSTELTFPTLVGPDLSYNGGLYDAFVAQLRGDGTGLVYSGYIGGDQYDGGTGVAVDEDGSAYVSGGTDSDQATFPVTLGPSLTYGGASDAFVARIEPGGASLLYAGYIGGAVGDAALGIAIDAAGNAYVSGLTASTATTFPVLVGPDLTYNGAGTSAIGDAFIAKVSVVKPCPSPPGVIGGVLAVKGPSSFDDVSLSWVPDLAANGYNIWYVGRKDEIDLARQANQPPAVPVVGCATPSPASGSSCTDVGGVSRGVPTIFFYQVRAFCDPLAEGP